MGLSIILSTFLAACLGHAAGPTSEMSASQRPEVYLRAVYLRYSGGRLRPDTLGSEADYLFAAHLANLLRASQDKIPRNDQWEIDPICQCTDYSNVVIQDIRASAVGATAARVKVHFRTGSAHKRLTFRLVKERGIWRIADIEGPGPSSFKRALQNRIQLRP